MLKSLTLTEFAHLSTVDTLKEVNSLAEGLQHSEVLRRLQLHGKNVLSQEKKTNVVKEFLLGFKNPLILILLFAVIVSAGLGEIVNAIIIAIIILLSTILNFLQEYRANQAAQHLKEKVATKALVKRAGETVDVKIADLCVGDIILLSSGDLIPADARVLEANDFFVNQSALTGESFPVKKVSHALHESHLSLGELENILFFGTSVVTGSATAVIIKTGGETEFGKIAINLTEKPAESEFTRGIRTFSLLIMRTTIFFVLFIFLINSLVKLHDLFESFTFAIAIAVGLTPELLPMIMSVNMARGSEKMAKKGVIVKRLASIPNFGSMDVLCTDKTGTLTKDKIELVQYTDVAGNHSENVLLFAFLNSSFQTGIKNPMDDAIIAYKKVEDHGYKKIDEIPFDFVRKKMSIVVEKHGKRFIITKGAPEEVFKSSTHFIQANKYHRLNSENKEEIFKTYNEFSKQGHRVLAIAIKEVEKKSNYTKHDEIDLNLLGFVAFIDPAKEGVKEAIADLKKMGIEVKVITGDNELVTEKICQDVGLEVKGILLGYQIDELTDDALHVVVERTTIFARFSPDEKNRIINALKANKHVVGYMGDGINDAPSLKTADVGISVQNAVDIAKEAASMILTHKSLRELHDGVVEGRKTFGNTMKYIMMGVSSNFGNMFSVLGAVLFLPYLPMLPIQILLNNFLYDFSQITIPSDTVDQEFVSTPKRWDIKLIRSFMIIFGPISSIFDFLTFYILYGIFHTNASVFQTGWFLESLATQTLVIYIIRTRKIPFIESMPSKYLLLSTLSVVIFGWIIPFTFLGSYFMFAVLPFKLLLTLVLIALTYLLTTELGKRFFYQFYSI